MQSVGLKLSLKYKGKSLKRHLELINSFRGYFALLPGLVSCLWKDPESVGQGFWGQLFHCGFYGGILLQHLVQFSLCDKIHENFLSLKNRVISSQHCKFPKAAQWYLNEQNELENNWGTAWWFPRTPSFVQFSEPYLVMEVGGEEVLFPLLNRQDFAVLCEAAWGVTSCGWFWCLNCPWKIGMACFHIFWGSAAASKSSGRTWERTSPGMSSWLGLGFTIIF